MDSTQDWNSTQQQQPESSDSNIMNEQYRL